MLGRLVRYNLRVVRTRHALVLTALAATSAFQLIDVYSVVQYVGLSVERLGFADNIGLIFAGSAPFVARPGVMCVPPLGWMLLLMLHLYLTLGSSTWASHGFEQQALVSSGSRKTWFMAKVISVTIECLLASITVLAVAMLWTAVYRQTFTLQINPLACSLAGASSETIRNSPQNGTWFLVGAAMMPCLLSLAQLGLARFIRPVYAFLVMTTLLTISAYAQQALLLGNYLMLARWSGLVVGGVSTAQGVALTATVSLVCILTSYARFSHSDILGKEGVS